jgi:phospholipase C
MSNPIENIIVLMLENRSFDNILGNLYPHSSTFEGLILDGSMSNTYQNQTYRVTNESSGNWFTTPPVDPGESFQDMNLQIFNNTDGSGTANMGGFVNDWMATTEEYPGIPTDKECDWAPSWPSLPRCPDSTPCPGPTPSDIMFYYTTSGSSPQLPVTGALAQWFAVCDAWFGSSPTQTFPNRFFVNCATAGGYVQDVDYVCNLEIWPKLPSVFELLDGSGGPNLDNWRVYFHDYGIATMINYVLRAPVEMVRNFDDSDYGQDTKSPTFLQDVANQKLPKYSFVEPRYGGFSNLPPNSNHPPQNVIEGEILLATVYNAIAQSEYYWPRTLLIITYDEHGGCFDHVVPPAAVPPGGTVLRNASTSAFSRYGPRVPAILVSPYIAAGTVLRPEGFAYNPVASGITTTNGVTPFDHTSIIKTVVECFNIQSDGNPAYLTQRDLNAPSLLSALTLTSQNMNSPGPVAVPALPGGSAASTSSHLADVYRAMLKQFGSRG